MKNLFRPTKAHLSLGLPILLTSVTAGILFFTMNREEAHHEEILSTLHSGYETSHDLQEAIYKAKTAAPSDDDFFAVVSHQLVKLQTEIAEPEFFGDARSADLEAGVDATQKTISRHLLLVRRFTWIDAKRRAGQALPRSLRTELAQLEKTLTDDDIHDAIRKVETSYLRIYSRDQRVAMRAGWILIAFNLLLVALLIIYVSRLRQSADRNRKLNEELEVRVEDRTAALNKALHTLEENQHALAQATKMSALGEMAGGIAHEINTPLQTIQLRAETIRHDLEKSDTAAVIETGDRIVMTVQRISQIIVGLRRFARDSSGEKPAPVRLDAVIRDTIVLCSDKLKVADIPLKIVDAEGIAALEAHCVPEQVVQVLLNLLNNAVDAIAPLDERWITIDVTATPDFMHVGVTDSGRGIPPEVRNKLMQPFFTTKGVGKGTGLGLSISKGLIESQHGRLEYDETSPNTRFVISIPRYDEYKIAS